MIVFNNGPWGQKPKNSGNGQKPQNGGDDIADIFGHARSKFKGFSGGGFSGGGADHFPPGRSLLMFVVLVFFVWMGTGFYRVEPQENAVITTFGKWTDTRTLSGLGYHWPWPIQDALKVNVGFDRRIEIGFRDSNVSGNESLAQESMMLTGDQNIININFVVLWRVSDAGKFLFNIRDPEDTIKKVSESAMREIVGHTPIQQAMTGARGDIETQTKELMQNILDSYGAGVTINSVQLLRVDPPPPVVDAFDDVQRARTDMERMKNEADTYSNDILPRARGQAQKIVQDAEGYKGAVIDKATGEAARFLSVYKAYTGAPAVTRTRIYIDTMQDIMKNSRKVITGDGKDGPPLLPYLQLSSLQDTPAAVKKEGDVK